jgi:hypothetical protein
LQQHSKKQSLLGHSGSFYCDRTHFEPEETQKKKTLTFFLGSCALLLQVCDQLCRSCLQVAEAPTRQSTRLAAVATGEASGETSVVIPAEDNGASPQHTSTSTVEWGKPSTQTPTPPVLPGARIDPPATSFWLLQGRLGCDVYTRSIEAAH